MNTNYTKFVEGGKYYYGFYDDGRDQYFLYEVQKITAKQLALVQYSGLTGKELGSWKLKVHEDKEFATQYVKLPGWEIYATDKVTDEIAKQIRITG